MRLKTVLDESWRSKCCGDGLGEYVIGRRTGRVVWAWCGCAVLGDGCEAADLRHHTRLIQEFLRGFDDCFQE